MQIGMVGLGKMGLNMVRRLKQGPHEVVAYSVDKDAYGDAKNAGAVTTDTLVDLVAKLKTPRVVWMMVPSGAATDQVSLDLAGLLSAGDIIIDGGNSFFKDSVARAKKLAEQSIGFLDIGTSGGIWGLEVGYCMMVGGKADDVKRLAPALDTLAPPDGWKHVGPSGAGHYVKMVHNGIEYGMMAAYAEGFEILHTGPFDLDLQQISGLWNQGSVVRSWLLELAESAFGKDKGLESIRDWVADSGEGRWTVASAIEQDVPAPVITLALQQRLRSRQDTSFSAKVLAALRNEFGGHAVKKAQD
jgi:6-phosphogluconate dehydrogenase